MGQSKRKKSSSSSVSNPVKRSRKKTANSSTKASKTSNIDIITLQKQDQEKEPSCMPIVILDNGGWTVKHGTVMPTRKTHGLEDPSIETKNEHDDFGNSIEDTYTETPNCTARLRHQIGLLVGDEIHNVKNKAQLELNHPLERGYCTDFGSQLEVWRRVLQREHELQNPGDSQQHSQGLLGDVKSFKKKKNSSSIITQLSQAYPQCAFLLTQPFTPTTLSDRIDEILFLDLGFQRVSKRIIQCMSAYRYLGTTKSKTSSCCLVVDSGFSLTHIVPTVGAKAVENAIRRINVGGKLITNLYKEAVSYRQWNMMDEFFIMNEAKEKTSFISNDFHHDLAQHARRKKPGFRWFDREFVLPNFVSTFSGSVRLPPPLRKEREEENEKNEQKKENDQIENADANKVSLDDKKQTETMEECQEHTNIANDNNDDMDSDQETEEQRIQQMKYLKLQEQRRRELEQQEQQVVSLSVERFTMPEVLFYPSDIGLDQVGIAHAIVQSIQACDATLQAAMYENILLTGGNVKIDGFKQRIEKELRALAPEHYVINVTLPDDPIGYSWKGARDFARQQRFLEEFSVDKLIWEETSKKKSKGNDNMNLWKKMNEDEYH